MPLSNITLSGVQITRVEGILMQGRMLICFQTSKNTVYFNRELILMEQDSGLTIDSFASVENVLATDIVFDIRASDILGMRLIYYSMDEQRFVLLRFRDPTVYTTNTLARSDSKFREVACSDNYNQTLTCIVMKVSGELCQLDFTLDLAPTGYVNSKLSCRVAKYYDYSHNSINVVENFLVLGGRFLASTRNKALVYRINNATQWPLFAASSVDLSGLDFRPYALSITADRSSLANGSALIVQSPNHLTIYKLNDLAILSSTNPPFESLSSTTMTLTQQTPHPPSVLTLDTFLRKRITVSWLSLAILIGVAGAALLIIAAFLMGYFREELEGEVGYGGPKEGLKTSLVDEKSKNGSAASGGETVNGKKKDEEEKKAGKSNENGGSQVNGTRNGVANHDNSKATKNSTSQGMQTQYPKSGGVELTTGVPKMKFAEDYDMKTGLPLNKKEVPEPEPTKKIFLFNDDKKPPLKVENSPLPEPTQNDKISKADFIMIKGPGNKKPSEVVPDIIKPPQQSSNIQNAKPTLEPSKLPTNSPPTQPAPIPQKTVLTQQPAVTPPKVETAPPKLQPQVQPTIIKQDPPKKPPEPAFVSPPKVEPPATKPSAPLPTQPLIIKHDSPPKPPVQTQPKPTPTPAVQVQPPKPPAPVPTTQPPKPPTASPPKPPTAPPAPPKAAPAKPKGMFDDLEDFRADDFDYDYNDMRDIGKDDFNYSTPAPADPKGKKNKKRIDNDDSMHDFSKHDFSDYDNDKL
jgi:hypothetical protein